MYSAASERNKWSYFSGIQCSNSLEIIAPSVKLREMGKKQYLKIIQHSIQSRGNNKEFGCEENEGKGESSLRSVKKKSLTDFNILVFLII